MFRVFASVLFFVCRAVAAGEAPIELDTATGALVGTLTLPEARTKAPVMLILSGSGPTDRDGNSPMASGKNDALRLLAAALADEGIATVRYDKRGVGRSVAAARAEMDLRFEDYVRDAESWVRKLSADPRFTGVGLIGHSEGATIGLLVARRVHLSTYMSIAGPSWKAPDVLRRQLSGRLAPELAARSEAILTSLERGETVDDVPAELSVLYRPSVQPYLISWFKYAPTAEIAALAAPCLLIQGDTDVQVQVSDAKALGAAQPACEVVIVNGMNHVLKLVPQDRTKQIASYADPSLPVAPELIRTLSGFISRNAGMPAEGGGDAGGARPAH